MTRGGGLGIDGTGTERICRVAACALVLLGAALRWSLMGQSLWFDELYLTRLFLGSTVQWLSTLFVDDDLPFYYTFMFFWIKLFGDAEMSVRLPSFLSGVASIWLTYDIGRRAAGPIPAVLAALLFALSPAHIYYSAEASSYACQSFLFLVLVRAAFGWAGGGARSGAWAALYAAAGTALYFLHYYMSVAVLAVSLTLFVRRADLRVKVLPMIVGMPALLAAYLVARSKLGDSPFLPPASGYGYLRAFDLREAWMFVSNWSMLGNTVRNMYVNWGWPEWDLLLVQAACVVLTAAGVYAFRGPREEAGTERWTVLLAFGAVPVMLFLLQLAGFRHTYIERALIASLPFQSILVAAAVQKLSRLPVPDWAVPAALLLPSAALLHCVLGPGWKPGPLSLLWGAPLLLWILRRFRGVTLAVFLLALQVCVTGLYFQKISTSFTVTPPRPDWKGLSAFLAADLQRCRQEGADFQVFSSPLSTAVAYYRPDLTEAFYLRELERLEPRVRRTISALTPVLGQDRAKRLTDQLVSLRNIEGKAVVIDAMPSAVFVPRAWPARAYLIQGIDQVDIAGRVYRELTAQYGYRLTGSARFGNFLHLHRFDRDPLAPVGSA